MTVQPPPTEHPLITDKDGFADLQWILFFNQLFNGDAGTAWVPTLQGLTTVGVPKVSGRVYRISQYLSIFVATITPAQNGNVTSVAGSTFINNFPLRMQGNGFNIAVSGNLGSIAGMCDGASNNIYIPTLTGVTIPVTIIGFVEAS